MNFLKKIFSWLLSLFVGLFILIVILGIGAIWAGNSYAPTFIANQVENFTDFQLTIRDPYMRMQSGEVDFQGVVLKNPEDYPQPDFIDVNQLAVKVELSSVFTDTIVVDHADLDINNVALVVKKDKTSNAINFVDNLPVSGGDTGSKPKKKKKSEPKEAAGPGKSFLIKRLTVKLGTVEIADYSSMTAVKEKAKINYERTFENVDDLQDVVGPLVTDLQARGMTLFAKYFAAQVLSQPLDTVLKATEDLSGSAKGIGDTVAEGAGDLLKAITSPFSKGDDDSSNDE